MYALGLSATGAFQASSLARFGPARAQRMYLSQTASNTVSRSSKVFFEHPDIVREHTESASGIFIRVSTHSA
ncbi:hypothetical protein HYPSUDRAFT_673215 [Hypholoma sublateritium FD-334 SS-4]|uniref:Uncharacterized protein n=1 Tax=Hypholoma sublateritium (strain FD-334 SS-4) TaxID=945553 RepID=A0A0D2MEM8_HYPSF|nr:hypothetical protein HYPSUDRAFT_673215 [Hypholoma sublateritium FD-334 SS-4]